MKYLLILFIVSFMLSCNGNRIPRKALDIRTQLKTVVYFSDYKTDSLFKAGDTIKVYKDSHYLQTGDNGFPTMTVVLQ